MQDSMEQGFTLAKQGRDSIQFALERERESRKAWISATGVKGAQVKLQGWESRLGGVDGVAAGFLATRRSRGCFGIPQIR